MNSKYRMFKNFMYNDLGITKEDIKEWTKEAVVEVAENYISKQYSEFELDQNFRVAMTNFLNKNITYEVMKVLLDSYNITIESKEK